MALSAGDKATVLALRNHYFKAVKADGTEADSWPVDAAGTPYKSDATTPADATGADASRDTALDKGYKAKIGPSNQKLQDDLNTALDLAVTLGGV